MVFTFIVRSTTHLVRLFFSATIPVANDAEPNGTFATANTFPLNSTTTGHCHYYFNNEKDTLDWYTITTTVSGQLSWTISSQNGNLIFADLINGDGVTLITGNYTSNTLTQTANGLAAGTYYLRLHTFYDNQFVPYTLSNTFTAPTYSTDPEPNETAATATSFPLNGSVVGQIGYRYNGTRDNYDWWAVNVNADEAIQLR